MDYQEDASLEQMAADLGRRCLKILLTIMQPAAGRVEVGVQGVRRLPG